MLIAQRPVGKIAAGKWEFPGGKIEPGETAEAALHRELHEELGCTVEILRPLAPHTHEHAALRWVPAAELLSLDLPEADLPIIADYLRR